MNFFGNWTAMTQPFGIFLFQNPSHLMSFLLMDCIHLNSRTGILRAVFSYAHDKTLWLIDDTVPCDVYSAIPDYEMSLDGYRQAGLSCNGWHGDVYKTIFAIHDYHPEFSYCTLTGGANSQTILWKSEISTRKPIFSSITEINSLSYYSMLNYAKIIMPINSNNIQDYIFRSLNPTVDALSDSIKRVIIKSNFKILHSKITWRDRLNVMKLNVIFLSTLPARVYRKFKTGGVSAVLEAVTLLSG